MINIYITIGYLLEAALSTYYGMSLFPYKTENKTKNTILVFFTRVAVIILLLPISKLFTIKNPILFIASFLIFDYFYDAKKSHKALAIFPYYFSELIGEFFNSLISMYVLHMDYEDVMKNPVYTIFCVLFVYLVIAILCELIIIFVNKNFRHTQPNVEYFVVACGIFVFICGLNFYAIILYIYKSSNIHFVALAVTTFLGNVIAFLFLYKYIALQKEKESERIFINQQMVMQQQHYKELKQKYIDIRKLQHDFKNHLQTIEALKSIHAEDEMHNYISELSDSLRKTSNTAFCNNPAIDSVLYNKMQYAENHNIEIQITPSPLDNISVSDMDLCSIIYNLLDNAIERCEKEPDNRYIIFNIRKKGSYLVLECRNSCTEYTPQTSKSNKELHGLGMKIINSIAEKYNGNDYYTFKNNEFVHIVNIDAVSQQNMYLRKAHYA